MAITTASLRRKRQQVKRSLARLDSSRRAKVRKRRELLEKLRSARERDPQSEERAELLDQRIRELDAKCASIHKRVRELDLTIAKRENKLSRLAKRIKRRVRRRKQRNTGANAAVKWALDQVGKHETPPGSNWGEPVATWIRNAGYTGPVPWCGCFAHEAIVEVGKANVTVQLGYAPYITNAARAGAGGLRAVSAAEAQAGDVGSLWNGEHVVVLRGKVQGTVVPTVEGNTSASNGSQTNGGEVAAKVRSLSDFDVIARPDYPS